MAVAASALLAWSHAGSADERDLCAAQHPLDKYQLLRRVSLDLRGRVPTIDEYVALDKPGTTIESFVDGFVGTDEYRVQVRAIHDQMFWPNVTNVSLGGVLNQLRVVTGSLPGDPVYRIGSTGRANRFRGNQNAECDPAREQTEFDPAFPGQFRPINVPVDGGGVRHEGWRWVNPYWDPANRVKICAYDAQLTPSAAGQSCGSLAGTARAECGCGADARWCYGPAATVRIPIENALREQLARAVDDVSTGRKPYTDLVLSTRAHVDGKVAYWLEHLAPLYQTNLTVNFPDPTEPYPAKPFSDATWVEIDRGGLHAGVLTLPVFLLKFQTNRGRANRFRIAFQGEYFVPPANATPQPGCSDTASDLTKRCICQYCHSKLEPLAAHFGAFAEAGSTPLTAAAQLPKQNAACRGAGANTLCGRFYVTDTASPRAGWLKAYEYADEHPEYASNIERGPRALAQAIVQDGTLARVAVRSTFEELVKREMRIAGENSDERDLLERLAAEFAASGYSYPALVKKIVSLPQYRSIR
jgi:hypothetical protein